MNQTLDEDGMVLPGPSEPGPSREDANEDTLLKLDGEFESGQRSPDRKRCQREGGNSIPNKRPRHDGRISGSRVKPVSPLLTSDLEDDVLQVNALLEESCGDTATSADESIADENLLPVCQEVDENWEQKFLSSLSQNSDNEDGASDDEESVEMDDVLPEPLKIKSYKEALSELNHVTNFFTAQGASQLADELSKVVSKAQSLYLK